MKTYSQNLNSTQGTHIPLVGQSPHIPGRDEPLLGILHVIMGLARSDSHL